MHAQAFMKQPNGMKNDVRICRDIVPKNNMETNRCIYAHTNTHAHTYTHTLSLTHTLTHAHTLTHSLTHTRTHSLSLSLSISLSLCLSLKHTTVRRCGEI